MSTETVPFSTQLKRLGSTTSFTGSKNADQRWGQLLRGSGQLTRILSEAQANGSLVPLRDVADVKGGVVTRANSYFLVRELPFAQVPARFKLTTNDYKTVAAVTDGLDVACLVERAYLRPVLKGPEALATPTTVVESDLRLFHTTLSKAELMTARGTRALAYIKRGETTDYSTSADKLKGGIPAERSNVASRKQWYTVPVVDTAGPRIVIPEHLDRRYCATLVPADQDVVVLDKLFSVTPNRPEDAVKLLIGLNSILTWCQLELRGRTQLGQGVLEIKIPDLAGILVPDPNKVGASVVDAFKALSANRGAFDAEDMFSDERTVFEDALFKALNINSIEGDAFGALSTQFQLMASERRQRAESTKQERSAKAKPARGVASADGFATEVLRLLGQVFPSPAEYLPAGAELDVVAIEGMVEFPLTIGQSIFDDGALLSAGTPIAQTDDFDRADFVRVTLMSHPTLREVNVPGVTLAKEVMTNWHAAAKSWNEKFEVAFDKALTGVMDPRLRSTIKTQALRKAGALDFVKELTGG